MQFLQQLSPPMIVLAAVLASLLFNMVVLGLLLGGRDRHAVRLVEKTRREQRESSRRTLRRMDESERELKERLRRVDERMEQLENRQNSLAALKLGRPAGDPPRKAGRLRGLDKKHHVYTLARRGLRSEDIAKRLNMYPGEAELLLGLKQFQSGTGESVH